MTTYNTGNVLGSSDPRDLYDNAENLDNLVNGEQPAYSDRLGKSRKSWAGMESEFAAFIAASGYEFLGDYAAGIEITGYQQVVRDTSGEFWRLSGSTTLPYTTTGAGLPEGGAFVAVGDAVLRQELADLDKGAAMVARGVVAVDSIADLLALPEGQRKEGLRYLVASFWGGWAAEATYKGPKGGGEFAAINRAGLPHNGGTVIDPTVPHPDQQAGDTHTERLLNYLNGVGGGSTDLRFVRSPDGSIGLRPEWFGAKGDAEITWNTLAPGYTDDYAAFRKIVDIFEESQGDSGQKTGFSCLQISECGYMIGQTIECSGNMRILGAANPKMTNRGPTSFITCLPDMTEGIFKLTGLPAYSSIQFGFELDHVGFRGYNHGVSNRLPCAVRVVGGNGPARPFNVLSCHAHGFDNVFDIEVPQGTHTGVYNMNVTGSMFSGNYNTLRSRGLSSIGGLVFKGNVSEQGGRIDIEDAMGSVEISDNLLEGQSDAITVSMSKGHLNIGTNYWEQNSGVAIKLGQARSPTYTQVTFAKQFVNSGNIAIEIGHGWETKFDDAFYSGAYLIRQASEGYFLNGSFNFGGADGSLGLLASEQGDRRAIIISGQESKLLQNGGEQAGASSVYYSPNAPTANVLHPTLGSIGTFQSGISIMNLVALSGEPLDGTKTCVLCLRCYSALPTSFSRPIQLTSGGAPVSFSGSQISIRPGWNTFMIQHSPDEGTSYTGVAWRLVSLSVAEREALYVAKASSYIMPVFSEPGVRNPLRWAEPESLVLPVE